MKTRHNSDFRISVFPKLIVFDHQGTEVKEQIAPPPEKKPELGKKITPASAKKEGARVIDSANKSLDQLSSGEMTDAKKEKNTETNNKARDAVDKQIANILGLPVRRPYFWKTEPLEPETGRLERRLQDINKELETNLDSGFRPIWPPEMSPSQVGITSNYQGKYNGVRINVSYSISGSGKNKNEPPYRVNVKTTPVDKLTDNQNRYVGPQNN